MLKLAKFIVYDVYIQMEWGGEKPKKQNIVLREFQGCPCALVLQEVQPHRYAKYGEGTELHPRCNGNKSLDMQQQRH